MMLIKKMLTLIVAITLLSCNSTLSGSGKIDKSEVLKYENIFKNLKAFLTKEKGKLWNYQLYGPILLVKKDDRTIIANENDTKGILIKNGLLFTGILPKDINIANTVIEWNGKRWTMVALPLPDDYHERLNLLIHELFHRIQPEIGFTNLYQKSCAHLDNINGRIYLKLELEALKKALTTKNNEEQTKHLKNALFFRAYRYQLFPNAKENENLLELNEGLAEYTGTILSDRTEKDIKAHYIQAINNLYEDSTFVRSFAYRTIPVYGYFMRNKDTTWNLKISNKTNLTDFITNFFNVIIPSKLCDTVIAIQNNYKYSSINDYEQKRDKQQKKILSLLDKKFKNSPVLIIPLQNMKIGFNPGNLIPYRSLGTVYPNLRITDNWGILEANKGALVDKNWRNVIISEPTEITAKTIKGDGWQLELKNSWKIVRIKNNYTLSRD